MFWLKFNFDSLPRRRPATPSFVANANILFNFWLDFIRFLQLQTFRSYNIGCAFLCLFIKTVYMKLIDEHVVFTIFNSSSIWLMNTLLGFRKPIIISCSRRSFTRPPRLDLIGRCYVIRNKKTFFLNWALFDWRRCFLASGNPSLNVGVDDTLRVCLELIGRCYVS